ncbi:MAG TPA: hypothetical protein VHE30_11595 [Polyangiaceae bacterium]|nr:hypothetical protein [Polyangiaceae bacterium]
MTLLQGSQHAPRTIDAVEARAAVRAATLEHGVPSASPRVIEGLSAVLWWLPCSDLGRIVAPVALPRARAIVPPTAREYRFVPGDPLLGDEDEIVRSTHARRYVPFWVLGGEDGAYAVVDAAAAEVVAGELPVPSEQASKRLYFFVALAMMIVCAVGVLLFSVTAWAAGMCRFLPRGAFGDRVPLGLAAILALVVLPRTFVVLPRALAEPVARASTGYVSLPLAGTERALVRMVGWLALSSSVPQGAQAFTRTFTGDEDLLLPLVWFSVHVCVAIVAFWAARANAPSRRSDPLPLRDPGDADVARTVRTIVIVGAAGLTGAVLGNLFELFRWVPDLGSPPATIWMHRGGQMGALLGLTIAPMERVSRLSAALGICVDLLLSSLLGAVLSLVAGFLLVAVPLAVRAFRERGAEEWRGILWASAKQSWAFQFGSAAGRVAGTVAALFALGVAGSSLGEVLGERLGGILALSLSGEEES